MKKLIKKVLLKINYRDLVLGVIIGFFLGLYIFSLLVPSGLDMIRVYHLEKNKRNQNFQTDDASSTKTRVQLNLN